MQVMTRPDLKVMNRSVWGWAACFAAGQVLWHALAGVFWVRCGVVTLDDGLILTELIALACGQSLLSLVLTCRHWAHAFHPGLVLETVWSLGWRFAAASLATEAAFVSLLWFGSFALARLNESPLEGIFWIFTGWFAALALGAFVMRR